MHTIHFGPTLPRSASALKYFCLHFFADPFCSFALFPVKSMFIRVHLWLKSFCCGFPVLHSLPLRFLCLLLFKTDSCEFV